MVPAHELDPGSKVHDSGLRSQLQSALKAHRGEIDFLIVCGDIADKATIEQYEHFDILMGETCQTLGIGLDRVLVTPGNHDVDWSILKAAQGGISDKRLAARYDSIQKSHVVKVSTNAATGPKDLFSPPFIACWDSDELIAVSINTAAHDQPDVKNHPGSIDDETIGRLKQFANDADLKRRPCPKFLIIHHHPINYSNLIEKWKDFSILQSSEELESLSSALGFDFIVHGHRHQPRFTSRLQTDGTQLSILGCGSFSQEFPTFVYDKLSNQFHVIDIEQRDPNAGCLCGIIRSYAFSSFDGWRQSEDATDGIAHELKFGPGFHVAQLSSEIENTLTPIVLSKGKFNLAGIRQTIPRLQYVSDDRIMSLVRQTARDKGWSVFGDKLEASILLNEG